MLTLLIINERPVEPNLFIAWAKNTGLFVCTDARNNIPNFIFGMRSGFPIFRIVVADFYSLIKKMQSLIPLLLFFQATASTKDRFIIERIKFSCFLKIL